MRKYISSAFIMLLSFAVFAQNWCPPGAEWTYNYIGFNATGYSKIAFEKDTLINNFNCKKLSATEIYTQRDFLGNYSDTFIFKKQPFFTYTLNDTVYFFYKQAFHAAYFFNAQKGDTLQIVNPEPAGCRNDSLMYLVVDSSGSIQLNNETLRFYIARPTKSYPGQYISPESITIIEKFGAYTADGYMFEILPFFSCGFVMEQTYSLRCYKDDSFNLFQVNPQIDCNHLPTSIRDISNNRLQIQVAPNPAKDFIDFTYNSMASKHYELVNALGQSVTSLKALNETGKEQITTSALKDGIYWLKVYDKNGLAATQKVIVQKY